MQQFLQPTAVDILPLFGLLPFVVAITVLVVLKTASASSRRRSRIERAFYCVPDQPSASHMDPGERDIRVVVLVPAHNEEGSIEQTLASILDQSRPPDRLVVIADNCVDGTAQIARSRGVEVFETRENAHRKAGALAQCWGHVEPQLSDTDMLMIVDADTLLSRRFVENALVHLVDDSQLAAVGGCFYGRSSASGSGLSRFLGLLQRMEYARYHRSIARHQGVTSCLSGAGTMFRVAGLRELERRRGCVWDTTAMIEDYEITLALRHLGYKIRSPKACEIYTDVMPTVGRLWHQRIRWQRGTLNELRKYGVSRTTAIDYAKQIGLACAVVARFVVLLAIALSLIAYHSLQVDPVWSALALMIVIERAVTIRRLGSTAVLVAGLLVVEVVYDMFRECFFAWSAWLHFNRVAWAWHAT